jgi:multiple sugar transport system permease protein
LRPRSGLARSQGRWGVLFALPAIVGFLVFTLSPMVASGVIGLTNWTIGVTPTFTGGDNYRAIAQDALFWKSLSVTGYYALLAVPGGLLVAFITAALLNQARRGRGFFRTAFYLPVLVPPVASAVLWLWLFNPDAGLLNQLLGALGLPTSLWVYGEATAMPSVALMTVWGFGNMTLVFLAGLQGVSRELYEAAECDGASPVRRMWHITLPSISPVILFNLITGMIAAVQVFDAAYVMTQGGPNNATLVYVYYLYSKAFSEGQLGYASALAWILFLIIVVVTAVLFRTSRQWVFYEGGKR